MAASLHTLSTLSSRQLLSLTSGCSVECLTPLKFFAFLQHLYLGALYSLLALKSVLLDDFQAYYLGEIGS